MLEGKMLAIDPIWQPEHQQQNFRVLLNAMAYPGRCFPLYTMPQEGEVVLSILSTLLDAEVMLSDHHGLLRDSDWPMLQANKSTADQADYIVCDAARKPDISPKLGTLANPDQSATLIMVVNKLDEGDVELQLTGPGIDNTASLLMSDVHPGWFAQREEWNYAFPMGIDMIFVDDQQVTAIPRTTRVEIK
jgi:alpha-D-ribose 1-methylphosphonate 5-triphosphate synthase subunit PhnH